MRIVSLALLLVIGVGNVHASDSHESTPEKQTEDKWYHRAGRLTFGVATGALSAIGPTEVAHRMQLNSATQGTSFGNDIFAYVTALALSGLCNFTGSLASKKLCGKSDAWFNVPCTISHLLTQGYNYANTDQDDFAKKAPTSGVREFPNGPATAGEDKHPGILNPYLTKKEYMLSNLQMTYAASSFGVASPAALAIHWAVHEAWDDYLPNSDDSSSR